MAEPEAVGQLGRGSSQSAGDSDHSRSGASGQKGRRGKILRRRNDARPEKKEGGGRKKRRRSGSRRSGSGCRSRSASHGSGQSRSGSTEELRTRAVGLLEGARSARGRAKELEARAARAVVDLNTKLEMSGRPLEFVMEARERLGADAKAESPPEPEEPEPQKLQQSHPALAEFADGPAAPAAAAAVVKLRAPKSNKIPKPPPAMVPPASDAHGPEQPQPPPPPANKPRPSAPGPIYGLARGSYGKPGPGKMLMDQAFSKALVVMVAPTPAPPPRPSWQRQPGTMLGQPAASTAAAPTDTQEDAEVPGPVFEVAGDVFMPAPFGTGGIFLSPAKAVAVTPNRPCAFTHICDRLCHESWKTHKHGGMAAGHCCKCCCERHQYWLEVMDERSGDVDAADQMLKGSGMQKHGTLCVKNFNTQWLKGEAAELEVAARVQWFQEQDKWAA